MSEESLFPEPLPAHEDNKGLAQRRAVERRREEVSVLMLKGWSRDRIAEEFKVSPTTIGYDFMEIRKQWRQAAVDNVQEQALLDLARLEFIIQGQLDRAPYDFKAAEVVLKAISERATILGYKQGMTFDIEQYIRELATQNGYPQERAVEIAQRIKMTFK